MATQHRHSPDTAKAGPTDSERPSATVPSQADRDATTVLRVEIAALATALEIGDGAGLRVTLATLAQQIHLLQLWHDPAGGTCPTVTHCNGVLVARYADEQ